MGQSLVFNSVMLWWKAFHIIAMISWMAGLLYLFRLFIYHNEEAETVVKQRFAIMERRLLYGITTPAGIATLMSGLVLLNYNIPYFLQQRWFLLKAFFAALLVACHLSAFRMRRKLQTNPKPYKTGWLRLLNEIPTLLMILIVLLVILKPF